MEDFQAAFFQRQQDVEILRAKQRYTASMHFGGAAVECLLKAMICAILPSNAKGEKEWFDEKKDNNPGHRIQNPGHHYAKAIQCHSNLCTYLHYPSNHYIIDMLHKVQHPLDCHFIHLRYFGTEPDKNVYDIWHDTYDNVIKKLRDFK